MFRRKARLFLFQIWIPDSEGFEDYNGLVFVVSNPNKGVFQVWKRMSWCLQTATNVYFFDAVHIKQPQRMDSEAIEIQWMRSTTSNCKWHHEAMSLQTLIEELLVLWKRLIWTAMVLCLIVSVYATSNLDDLGMHCYLFWAVFQVRWRASTIWLTKVSWPRGLVWSWSMVDPWTFFGLGKVVLVSRWWWIWLKVSFASLFPQGFCWSGSVKSWCYWILMVCTIWF